MNIIAFLGFFGIFLAILVGTNLLVYLSLVNLFYLPSWVNKKYILFFLFIMALLFVVASILMRWKENLVVNWVYIISSFWLSIFLYIFFACVIMAVLRYGGWLLKLDFELKTLGMVLIATSFIVPLIGTFYARNTKIKEIEVQIKNLPDFWQGKKIVQISDAHLGAVYGKDFLEKTIKKINSQNPDLVFITGDLFDSMDGSLNTFGEVLNKIETKEGIYFVNGNHEAYLGLDKIDKIINGTKIKYLKDEIVDVKDLQIIGMNFGSDIQKRDIVGEIEKNKNFKKGQPTVLLYHAPENVSEIKKIGINLMQSGHTHRGQIFPFNFITKAIYGGYDQGLHKEGDFNIYIGAGLGTWGPPVRTNSQSEIAVIKLIKAN